MKEILETLKNNNCYSNFIDDINGGNEYYYLLEKSEGNLLLDYITNLDKEIDRLNNIIDELEKTIKKEHKYYLNQRLLKNPSNSITGAIKSEAFGYILDKLKELKEGK